MSLVSKLLESYVTVQLRQRLDNNNLLDITHSAYRHHSTETAPVHIQNDYLNSVEKKKGLLTVLIGQVRCIGI